MGVEVTRNDSEGWAAATRYASWSIHVEAMTSDGARIATFHDCATGTTAVLTHAEGVSRVNRSRCNPSTESADAGMSSISRTNTPQVVGRVGLEPTAQGL